MAWNRRRRRGGGRRFFRRRRRIRQTTESGSGRWERAYFDFLVDQPIAIGGAVTQDAVKCVGGGSFLDAVSSAGTQAAIIARVLSGPIKGFDVLALTFDLEAMVDPGFSTLTANEPQPLSFDSTHCGFALYTQRLTSAYTPSNLPNYHLSQWPINATTNDASNEDADYSIRTHTHRAFTLAPDTATTWALAGDVASVYPRFPRFRQSFRVKIKRRLTDDYALFFGFWNRPYADGGDQNNVFWRLTGSLWYKMIW